jgi:hypothetical protein
MSLAVWAETLPASEVKAASVVRCLRVVCMPIPSGR